MRDGIRIAVAMSYRSSQSSRNSPQPSNRCEQATDDYQTERSGHDADIEIPEVENLP
jgi:hypothetical protein